jgi:hypothetical protein
MTAYLTTLKPSKRLITNVAILLSLTALVFPDLGAASTAKAIGEDKSLVFQIKSQSIQKATQIQLATTEYTQNAGPLQSSIKVAPKIQRTITKTTATTAVTKTAPAGRVYWTEQQIAEYACPKFGADCKTFLAILKAENGTHECTRNNKGLNRNGSVDYGLAQINDRATPGYTVEQLMDCKTNIDIAYLKYKGRKYTFGAWSAYNSGAYKKHLAAINL